MSFDNVRVAIIGAGYMGQKHALLVSANPDSTLVAIADPFSNAAADDFGVPHFPSHEALLEAGVADAVIIANPNALHVETAIDCLKAGVAVLLEKPIATSHAEALRVVEAVEQTSGTLLVGHQRRHHPTIAAARKLIEEGKLGRIVAVNGLWAARKPDSYFAEEWRRLPGGGVMLINLVHDLDLLRYLLGEVATVQTTTSNAVRGFAVEDTASYNLRFASGAVGSFIGTDAGASPWGWDQATHDSSTIVANERDSAAFFLTGTKGALTIPDIAVFSYEGEGEGEWSRPMSRTYAPLGFGDSHARQLVHFIDVTRGIADPIVSAADAARTMALMEAAQAAAATGTTVELAHSETRSGSALSVFVDAGTSAGAVK